jgi:hypothetical protein
VLAIDSDPVSVQLDSVVHAIVSVCVRAYVHIYVKMLHDGVFDAVSEDVPVRAAGCAGGSFCIDTVAQCVVSFSPAFVDSFEFVWVEGDC